MRDVFYRNIKKPIKPFEFDEKIVDIFPDMVRRSIPGYLLTISMIEVIADGYIKNNSNVYDLGCSLGEVSFAIKQAVSNRKYKIIAVDNSKAMIDACRKNNKNIEISFLQENILEIKLSNASVIVMNFTLQFIPKKSRKLLIDKIYKALIPGGVLIISEKVCFDEQEEQSKMTQFHHHMKQLNGYEKIEIANKRDALDKVLVSETIKTHKSRLKKAGFTHAYNYLRCFNFVSMVAFK